MTLETLWPLPGPSPRAAGCKALAHLSLRAAPLCPAAWRPAGVCCQSALLCNHKPVVSWKEICDLEAKEQGPPSSANDTLCDLGSSPISLGRGEIPPSHNEAPCAWHTAKAH